MAALNRANACQPRGAREPLGGPLPVQPRDVSDVPQKSAIWPVRSFPETANKNRITSLFKKKLKKLSSSLAQPNLCRASLKTDYNKSINSNNQPKTEQKRLRNFLGASLTSLQPPPNKSNGPASHHSCPSTAQGRRISTPASTADKGCAPKGGFAPLARRRSDKTRTTVVPATMWPVPPGATLPTL